MNAHERFQVADLNVDGIDDVLVVSRGPSHFRTLVLLGDGLGSLLDATSASGLTSVLLEGYVARHREASRKRSQK